MFLISLEKYSYNQCPSKSLSWDPIHLFQYCCCCSQHLQTTFGQGPSSTKTAVVSAFGRTNIQLTLKYRKSTWLFGSCHSSEIPRCPFIPTTTVSPIGPSRRIPSPSTKELVFGSWSESSSTLLSDICSDWYVPCHTCCWVSNISPLIYCHTESESGSHSVVSDSLQPQWTAARQSPLSMEFPRQDYWSG